MIRKASFTEGDLCSLPSLSAAIVNIPLIKPLSQFDKVIIVIAIG
jgi:hypothetical protein